MVFPSHAKKWEFSILSTDLASPALHRLHHVISDFRPPSVSESGEAALRRLLASRAVGGCSLSSDDPVPGWLTVFQSSRVARPQDASKAPYLVSLSSARSYLVQRMLRLFLRLLTWKADWHRPVDTVDPVFRYSRRRNVGDQRFIIDTRASNRHFLNSPS